MVYPANLYEEIGKSVLQGFSQGVHRIEANPRQVWIWKLETSDVSSFDLQDNNQHTPETSDVMMCVVKKKLELNISAISIYIPWYSYNLITYHSSIPWRPHFIPLPHLWLETRGVHPRRAAAPSFHCGSAGSTLAGLDAWDVEVK